MDQGESFYYYYYYFIYKKKMYLLTMDAWISRVSFLLTLALHSLHIRPPSPACLTLVMISFSFVYICPSCKMLNATCSSIFSTKLYRTFSLHAQANKLTLQQIKLLPDGVVYHSGEDRSARGFASY
jgi:hypothetical protein